MPETAPLAPDHRDRYTAADIAINAIVTTGMPRIGLSSRSGITGSAVEVARSARG